MRTFPSPARSILACLATAALAANLTACPDRIGSMAIHYADCIHRDGDLLFLGTLLEGLVVVDISDPASPAILDAENMRVPECIVTHEGLAYVSNLWDGLAIVDCTDPHALVTLSTTELPDWRCGKVSYWSGHVYIEDYSGGVQILDVSDPYSPVVAAVVSAHSLGISDATVHDGHLYVSEWGIDVYSLADPDSPVPLDVAVLPQCSSNLEGSGDLFCNYSFWGETCLSTVADPENPVPFAEFELSDRVQDVSFRHDLFAAVSDGQWELVPLGAAEETRIGARIPMDDGRAIVLDGGLLFVTDRDSLYVYDVSCDFPPLTWFEFTPSEVEFGGTCTLDAGSCSDLESPDDAIMVRWDFDSNGEYDTEWSTDRVLVHPFDVPGEGEVTLESIDGDGNSNVCTRVVPVRAAPVIELIVDPTEGTTATTFVFYAGGTTDPDDPDRELWFTWYFDYPSGPDVADTLDMVMHQYADPGDHELRLYVRDADDLVSMASSLVHVEAETAVRRDDAAPLEFSLGAYPNPFNPRTVIEVALDQPGRATLDVYDLTGRRVRRCMDGQLSAGVHQVPFDAGSLASGVYIGVLNQGGRTATQRLLLMK